jgi:pimeloyl-ACP methyl ester carboxylesterase
VLVGKEDAATPVELSQEIATTIPGARLIVLRDCGHLSTMEKQELVTAELVAWVRG